MSLETGEGIPEVLDINASIEHADGKTTVWVMAPAPNMPEWAGSRPSTSSQRYWQRAKIYSLIN